MKVLVGSTNPVKIEAVKEAFSKYFGDLEVVGMKVDSKVRSQPVDDETFDGAKNRATALKKINDERGLGAKFFVGIEGGMAKSYSRWLTFGGMCVMDDRGRMGFGTSPQFELPESIVPRLLAGTELGDVMDEITGGHNTKQKSGAIGFFTKNAIDRKSAYVHGLVAALVPFINEELYFRK